MSDEKKESVTKTEAKVSEKPTEPKGKVFNFTREGVTIIAKTRKEAEESLKDQSKEKKETK